jgi:hypothetical protein
MALCTFSVHPYEQAGGAVMGYNATYGFETPDIKPEKGQIDFLVNDPKNFNRPTIKAEYRVNKKQKPFIRTATEK